MFILLLKDRKKNGPCTQTIPTKEYKGSQTVAELLVLSKLFGSKLLNLCREKRYNYLSHKVVFCIVCILYIVYCLYSVYCFILYIVSFLFLLQSSAASQHGFSISLHVRPSADSHIIYASELTSDQSCCVLYRGVCIRV